MKEEEKNFGVRENKKSTGESVTNKEGGMAPCRLYPVPF